MLNYNLVENLLTAAPDDYMAQTVNVRSYTESEIADLIMSSGAGLTMSDILSVLQAEKEIICRLIADGNAVNIPLFNAQPSITGVFNGAGDSFDPSRHQVKINLSPGIELRKAIKQVKTKKVQVADVEPILNEVRDIASGSVNEVLTPDSIVQITGARLRFLPEDPTNGIFLIHIDTGEEFKLEVVAENKPARLMAMLSPIHFSGEHYLEVRTTNSGNVRPLKTLKIGRFRKVLITP